MNAQEGRTVARENPIPQKKVNLVSELANLIKTKQTVLLASIKNLPASQFQEIGKKLRGKAIVKVPKKNLIFRAIDDSGNDAVMKLKEKIKDSTAVLFSDLDSFELAGELMQNKSPAKAKPGQIAPEDIEIPEGPTELVPGPAISELGALGIKIQIENGKITIKAAKVIAKEGEEISQKAADLMSKLDIKPFSIGYIPLCAFDLKEGKMYTEIKIDREEAVENLKAAHGKALPFAVEVGYPAEDTIKFLIGKAGSHGKVIEQMQPAETEKKVEEVAEEKAEEPAAEEPKDQTPEDKPEESPKTSEASPEPSGEETK
jgi:large subunit ribosomal protein L10